MLTCQRLIQTIKQRFTYSAMLDRSPLKEEKLDDMRRRWTHIPGTRLQSSCNQAMVHGSNLIHYPCGHE